MGVLRGAGLLALPLGAAALWAVPGEPTPGRSFETRDRELYEAACASCHGADGRGAPPERIAFEVPLPDFTDCSFASREPDQDWLAVSHDGGPARGFDPIMPAFGEALSLEQLQGVIDYIRTLCTEDTWPRGELNLPRALVTEKAYPEDEAVSTLLVNAGGPGAVMNELLYEKRFGPRSQVELKLPFGVRERPASDGDWSGGLGDVAVGVKHAAWHSFARGSIFSLGGEVVLPTGSRDRGFGKGTAVVEPYVAFGQILPRDWFLQLQLLAEVPVDEDKAEREAGWRGVLGWSGTRGRFGRTWSPMLEVLGSRPLEGGAPADWDLLPQVQVTLNTRQHVMLNLGVRAPLTRTDSRDPQLLVYLLWDWFDGGFFEGWGDGGSDR